MDEQFTSKDKHQQLTILIVDDSKTSATLIRQQMITLGTLRENIDICTSYQDAIKQVGTRFYDVLILDYHLEQCINGNELASLLSKKKLLSSQTGVILVSGDSRQETVLTALSGEVQHFIKKPIQTQALGNKVLSVGEDKKSILTITNIISDNTMGSDVKAYSINELTSESNSPVIIESNAMELLEENQDWEALAILHQVTTTSTHMMKVVSMASLKIHQHNTDGAIALLESFLSGNPLAHKVMDKLTQIFINDGQYYEALDLAMRSFECTPSIQEKMLVASKLSEKLNNNKTLMQIGKIFSKNLSIIDVSWLSAIIGYGDCILASIDTTASIKERNELINSMNRFFKSVSNRLTNKQLPFLNVYVKFFSAQVYIYQKKPSNAHLIIFKALSLHYNHLNKLPSALIIKIIKITDYFGEYWISDSLLDITTARNRFDADTKKALGSLLQDKIRVKNILDFNQRLATAHEALNSHEQQAHEHFKNILSIYPCNIEAQLGLLKSSILLEIDHQIDIRQLNSLVNENSLPYNWQSWIDDIESKGVNRPIPLAFDEKYGEKI